MTMQALEGAEVDFDVYAAKYDDVLRYSPPYEGVLAATADALARHVSPGRHAVIGDFGAGTGELARRIAEQHPAAEIVALEMHGGFLDRLRAKVGDRPNVRVVQADAETYDGAARFDAIAMVHVLALTKHAAELRAIRAAHRSLKPGGVLVVADIGRRLDLKKHALSSLRAVFGALGLVRTIRFYSANRDFFTQNRIFIEKQRRGAYPLHSLAELSARIGEIGFEILEQRDDLYLGDDDFVVARKTGG